MKHSLGDEQCTHRLSFAATLRQLMGCQNFGFRRRTHKPAASNTPTKLLRLSDRVYGTPATAQTLFRSIAYRLLMGFACIHVRASTSSTRGSA